MTKELDYDTRKRKLLKKIKTGSYWFCPKLFNHIYTDTDGTYKVCCIGMPTEYNVTNTDPKKWLESKKLNRIRNEMLSPHLGINSPGIQKNCIRCIKQERLYGESDRLKHIDQMFKNISSTEKHPLINQILDFLDSKKFKIKHRVLVIQTRIFGSQCNLDCYMCQPQNSTIRQQTNKKINYVKLAGFDEIIPLESNQPDTIDKLIKLAPYIGRFIIQGGEPLVMKKQYEFLDKLVASGHSKHIVLDMNSNLTVLGDTAHNILDYIDKFYKFEINVSIDSVGKYNDYIRRRSNWDDIIKNINVLKTYPNVFLTVFSTVSLLSVLRYQELENFCKSNNLDYRTFIIDDPDALHIKHLPLEIKDRLIKQYKHSTVIQNALLLEGDRKKFNNALAYIKKMDQLYNTDVFDLYPELKEFDQNL